MKQVEWTNDLSVGIELVDEQHKMLIQRLNDLTEAVQLQQGPYKIGSTLDFLIEYTDFHFSEEERHMAANGYPNLETHKLKHEEFKSTLSALEQDFRDDGPTHDLAASIDTLLVNWLLKHIRAVDTEFGTFLKGKGITLAEEG